MLQVFIFIFSPKLGDRYWYENDIPPSSFTREQLNEIRKVSLAQIICENIPSIGKTFLILSEKSWNQNQRILPIKGSLRFKVLVLWKYMKYKVNLYY